MTQLYRKHPFQDKSWGFDSIQGVLEYIDRTAARRGFPSRMGYSLDPTKDSYVYYLQLKTLQDEQYILIEWEKELHKDGEFAFIKDASLTIKGHLLLVELDEKSGFGRVKRRIGELFWIVVTAILTTLATLKFTGE